MQHRRFKAISILRLYVSGSGLVVAGYMLKLMDAPESGGYQMGFLIGLFSLLGFADTVINDIMSERFVSNATKRWRNIGFMILALSYAGAAFFLSQYRIEPPSIVIARLVIDAAVCVVIAFAGLGEVLEEQAKHSGYHEPT